jgi:hypothetical protein
MPAIASNKETLQVATNPKLPAVDLASRRE